jgi:hypothetical protein
MTEQPDEFKHIEQQFHRSHGSLPDSVSAGPHIEAAIRGANMITPLDEYTKNLDTPPPSPDFEMTSSTLDLPFPTSNGFTLENVQPIGAREIETKNGAIAADILGVVTFESTNEHFQILRLQNGSVTLGQLMPDGSFKLSNMPNGASQHVTQGTGRGSLSIVAHGKEDQQRIAVRFSEGHGNPKPANPHLLLAEETRRIDVVREQSEERRRKKIRFGKNLAKVAIALVTTWAVLVPGGLADMVMDPLVTAHSVVARAEAFSGHSEKDLKAAATVESLLNDLDNNQYDAVKKAAAEYNEQHRDAFIDPIVLAHMQESIAQASSAKQIEQALQPAKERYGYDFVISPNASIDDARYTAGQILAALSTIPKDILKDAKLNSIYVDSPDEIASQEGSEAQGYYTYDDDDNQIHIKATSAFNERYSTITSPPGIANGSVVQETFDHEFGHSLDNGLPGVFNSDQTQLTGDPQGSALRDLFMGGILDSPEIISSYARTDSAEHTAEDLSGIFSQRRDGLAWPDQSRAFNSESNVSLVASLIIMEKLHPGSAATLLMHRFADKIQ